MRSIVQHLRYALRQLRKSRGFTVTAVLTLALGIGANTAIFTVVYSTLLAPMPYPQPDQLVMVWSKIQGGRNSIAAQDFEDWKHQNTAFQDLNAFTGGSFNLATKEQPEYVQGQFATPGLYRMNGIKFLYGRDFLSEEGTLGKEREVILMNKEWKRLGAASIGPKPPALCSIQNSSSIDITSMNGAEKLCKNRIDSTPHQTTNILSAQKPRKLTHSTAGLCAVAGQTTAIMAAIACPPNHD